MPSQDFTITQLKYDGGSNSYIVDPSGLKVVWNVGNRAIPVQPWEYDIDVRTAREDYPGTSFEPVEQVMGPNFGAFSLRGMFDDKWGGPGFADVQRQALERLASDTQLVRIAFEVLSFDCLIKNVKILYFNNWRIGYSFTVSPHRSEDQGPEPARTVATATPAADFSDRISQSTGELSDLMDTAPVAYMASTLASDAAVAVADITSRADTISDVVSGRVLVVVAPALADLSDQPVNSVLKVAADLEGLRASSMALVASLGSARTDLNLAYEETLLNLTFDAWAKLLCAQARFIAVQARAAAIEMRRRAQPDAQALYRPRAGESLYDVANKFTGSPDAWRPIAARNNLSYLILDGTELLVIPSAA